MRVPSCAHAPFTRFQTKQKLWSSKKQTVDTQHSVWIHTTLFPFSQLNYKDTIMFFFLLCVSVCELGWMCKLYVKNIKNSWKILKVYSHTHKKKKNTKCLEYDTCAPRTTRLRNKSFLRAHTMATMAAGSGKWLFGWMKMNLSKLFEWNFKK